MSEVNLSRLSKFLRYCHFSTLTTACDVEINNNRWLHLRHTKLGSVRRIKQISRHRLSAQRQSLCAGSVCNESIDVTIGISCICNFKQSNNFFSSYLPLPNIFSRAIVCETPIKLFLINILHNYMFRCKRARSYCPAPHPICRPESDIPIQMYTDSFFKYRYRFSKFDTNADLPYLQQNRF